LTWLIQLIDAMINCFKASYHGFLSLSLIDSNPVVFNVVLVKKSLKSCFFVRIIIICCFCNHFWWISSIKMMVLIDWSWKRSSPGSNLFYIWSCIPSRILLIPIFLTTDLSITKVKKHLSHMAQSETPPSFIQKIYLHI